MNIHRVVNGLVESTIPSKIATSSDQPRRRSSTMQPQKQIVEARVGRGTIIVHDQRNGFTKIRWDRSAARSAAFQHPALSLCKLVCNRDDSRAFLKTVWPSVDWNLRLDGPRLSVEVHHEDISVGNWAGPADLIPRIVVDQSSALVRVYYRFTRGRKAGGVTHEHVERLSPDRQSLLVTCHVGLRNYKNSQCGGRQHFVFAIFVGDSGHIYIHRAPATSGWLNCPPDRITARLRKLGCGAENVAYQQGDFLLKHARGNAYPPELFAHETFGAGHHRFLSPVLYADGDYGRQIRLTETLLLRHEPVDGVRHPDIVVQPGTYIIGLTSSGLNHSNSAD